MATCRRFAVVLLQIFTLFCWINAELEDLAVIQGQAYDFDAHIDAVLNRESGYQTITNEYNIRQSRMVLEAINGVDTVQATATAIGQMLDRKVEALRKSVDFAEQLAQEYVWDESLTLEPTDWINAKKVNLSGEGYAYDNKFEKIVNYYNSSVHIPVEIYEGDVDILNGLTWTRRLEEQWKRNLQDDDTLLWQYFGTQSGIFRMFPASAWTTRGEVDLYDVRRRAWYTQGASSAKDMLILVDTSGSTYGQALALMKQAVKSLIDTLGENDFVKVAHFSESAHPVGCFPHFVQANHRNKKLLFATVDNMEAKGMANYRIGLRYAFEQFIKLEATWTGGINATKSFYEQAGEGIGARCNRIIMFLTDGGTEMPEDLFREYNWPEKKIRIFAYAVGPTANPIAAVKWIACANKGYFARIPAMGAIRSTVQNYVPVLARPRAIKNVKSASWTNVRHDSRGLGMMTTVTLPVYNRTEEITNQTILGVMGTDVTTEEMMAFIPRQKLGTNGYAFAINNNGYVVFHPKLKAQQGWLDDPPNVDLLDVEEDTDQLQQLRRDMIDGRTGEQTITSWSIASDEMHLDQTTKTYSYTNIPGTNFSLAIVTEGSDSNYFKSAKSRNETGGNETDSESRLTSTETAVLLAPWEFCNNLVAVHGANTSSADILYQISSDSSACDQSLLEHLLFDALATAVLEGKWASMAPGGIDARFVATQGGLTRVYPKDAGPSFEEDRDIKKALYFQRALNSQKWIFSAKYHTGLPDINATEPVVTAARSIKLSGASYKAAVTGVRMEQEELLRSLVNIVPACGHDYTLCYLLDDGAYLILSSLPEDRPQVGQFFGEVDVVLMRYLVNNSIFIKHEKYDYQAACPVEKRLPNAGSRSVFVPVIMDMLSVNWWTTKAAWLYAQYNIYDWLIGFFQGAEAASMGGDDFVERNKSCVKLMTQYSFNDNEDELRKKEFAICGNCTRTFATSRLAKTNLLLVMAELDCDGECERVPLDSHPRPVEDPMVSEAHHGDTCPVQTRYRARPAPCYDYDTREDDSECGSSSRLVPSALLTLLHTLLLLVLLRVGGAC